MKDKEWIGASESLAFFRHYVFDLEVFLELEVHLNFQLNFQLNFRFRVQRVSPEENPRPGGKIQKVRSGQGSRVKY